LIDEKEQKRLEPQPISSSCSQDTLHSSLPPCFVNMGRVKPRHAAAFALIGWYLPLLLGLGLLVLPSGAMPQQNSSDFRAASRQPSVSQYSDHLPSIPGSVPPSNSVQEIPQIYLGCWQGTLAQPDSWQQFSGPPLARGPRPL